MNPLHLPLADVPGLCPMIPDGSRLTLARNVGDLDAGVYGTLITRDLGDAVIHIQSPEGSDAVCLSWADLALDLTPPTTSTTRDGAHDLAVAIARTVGLDVSRGVTWRFTRDLILWLSVVERTDGPNMLSEGFAGRPFHQIHRPCQALASVDPAEPNADRLALLDVVRHIFGARK